MLCKWTPRQPSSQSTQVQTETLQGSLTSIPSLTCWLLTIFPGSRRWASWQPWLPRVLSLHSSPPSQGMAFQTRSSATMDPSLTLFSSSGSHHPICHSSHHQQSILHTREWASRKNCENNEDPSQEDWRPLHTAIVIRTTPFPWCGLSPKKELDLHVRIPSHATSHQSHQLSPFQNTSCGDQLSFQLHQNPSCNK